AAYFKAETARIEDRCLVEVRTLDDWQRRCEEYRARLFEMLSLAPLPARGDLRAAVTGRVERDSCVVENVHFQSLPGLYVTANLYVPKNLARPAPTILYLSGHGPVISNGVSFGNKVAYQHHGAWFARHGYACLIVDSLQLGEILGLHHGTYREGLWWWNSRGYTPAGVEAWNCVRALDYLETRPEVDKTRFGVTGRSGGGAYSWWIAALDDRIKAAAPVAGITDLHNHVVDGTVEGHCDCMFTVNTWRWDYPQVAALVAPRPLLIVNTDADSIFPLDGVQRLHAMIRRIYALHRAADKLGLVIGPGPHKDTQDLQVPVLRWFNRHLRGDDPLIEAAAMNQFTSEQLKVFRELPTDAINTNIHETFVAAAPTAAVPKTKEDWERQRREWLAGLGEKCFGGWPEIPPPLAVEKRIEAERDDVRLQAWDFTSQENVRLRLYLATGRGFTPPGRVELGVLGPSDTAGGPVSYDGWLAGMAGGFPNELRDELAVTAARANGAGFDAIRQRLQNEPVGLAWLAPRGVGLDAWNSNPKKQVQIRRRFMLLGQTLDGMRVWDIRRGVQALRALPQFKESKLSLAGAGDLACDALYAALHEPGIEQLNLWALPESHRPGPDYLNVLRVLDVPQAVALAAEHSSVRLHGARREAWAYPRQAAAALGWPAERLRVESDPLVQSR
ncbi:MAG TPA: CocE/NonD family hydrolase, partial [Verrucomicrobiae bacterium]|nr:CocE/NonD family hydrolase [Verrucomicrobiae bacterium]